MSEVSLFSKNINTYQLDKEKKRDIATLSLSLILTQE